MRLALLRASLLLLLLSLLAGPRCLSAGEVPQFDTTAWTDVSELQIEVLEKPSECPHESEAGDMVYIHYTGFLVDGKVAHTSREEGYHFEFVLGSGVALAGVDKGLYGACAGEKRLVRVPPELAFGDIGSGDVIPPNATMIYELETLKIKTKAQIEEENNPTDDYEDPEDASEQKDAGGSEGAAGDAKDEL